MTLPWTSLTLYVTFFSYNLTYERIKFCKKKDDAFSSCWGLLDLKFDYKNKDHHHFRRKIWRICFGGGEQTKASSAFTLYYSPANAWHYCYIIIFFIIIIITIIVTLFLFFSFSLRLVSFLHIVTQGFCFTDSPQGLSSTRGSMGQPKYFHFSSQSWMWKTTNPPWTMNSFEHFQTRFYVIWVCCVLHVLINPDLLIEGFRQQAQKLGRQDPTSYSPFKI